MALTNSKGDGKGIKVGNDTQRIIEESFKILMDKAKQILILSFGMDELLKGL